MEITRMNETQKPNFTGIVANFSSALISNDGIPYFEFALTLPPPPSPPEPPGVKVLYVNLRKDYSQAIVSVVISAWASREQIDVYLDNSIPEPDRVRRARLTPK